MIFLPFVFLIPLCSFFILKLTKSEIDHQKTTNIGVGSMFVSAIVAFLSGMSFLLFYNPGSVLNVSIGGWFEIANYIPKLNLAFDGLTLVMLTTVAFIGFLIHQFSSWYLHNKFEYSRYISYLNLLIVAIFMLILADNLIVLYLSWEAVTAMTYLLISFDNERLDSYSITKSFLVSRLSNTFFAFGLVVLFLEFDTINILKITDALPQYYSNNNPILVLIASSLAIGVMGLSAQLPLHIWLSKVTTTRTPTIAIIFSSVITLGAYIIARFNALFQLTPDILFWWIGVVGAVNMLVGALCALVQTDIKKLLVYMAISQVGFILIALGTQSWHSAIFYLVNFSVFQTLLTLTAGCLLKVMNQDQNLLTMGTVRQKMPLIFWSLIIGVFGLLAMPFVTSNFYIKQNIVLSAYINGHYNLYLLMLLGTFLTILYAFRMIKLIFFSKVQKEPRPILGHAYKFPLVILMILVTAIPTVFKEKLAYIFAGILPANETLFSEVYIKINFILVVLSLLLIGLLSLERSKKYIQKFKKSDIGGFIHKCCYQGLGFNELYESIFIKPLKLIYDKCKIVSTKSLSLSKTLEILENSCIEIRNGTIRGFLISWAVGLFVTILAVFVLQIFGTSNFEIQAFKI